MLLGSRDGRREQGKGVHEVRQGFTKCGDGLKKRVLMLEHHVQLADTHMVPAQDGALQLRKRSLQIVCLRKHRAKLCLEERGEIHRSCAQCRLLVTTLIGIGHLVRVIERRFHLCRNGRTGCPRHGAALCESTRASGPVEVVGGLASRVDLMVG